MDRDRGGCWNEKTGFMLQATYIYRNLTRNWLRTLLTLAAVGLPIMIYVLSMAVVAGFDKFLDNAAKQLRLAVTHKSSIVNPLPSSYVRKIESLDPTKQRILSVCGIRWIGGQLEGRQVPLSTLAVDADAFLATFPEHQLSPEEVAAWQRDRQALVVGYGTAGALGWKVGDRVNLRQSLPPYSELEFHVVSLAVKSSDAISLWCRRDYLDESNKDSGVPSDIVSFIFVKCATPADLDHYRVAIDDLFARTPDETKTQDEKTFMNEFITQQFNLPRNLTILAWVTVCVAVMASANTMSMNFRDRGNELAVFKALGFSGALVFGLIQVESLFVCLLGGLLGALGPYVAFTHTPLKDYPIPIVIHLDIPVEACAQALLISLVIGVAAAFWPSVLAYRLTAVQALRNME